MAVSLWAREVSELCLGKPALRWISGSATVGEALWTLKKVGERSISVWSSDGCRCVGKVCMADVICFLSNHHNLSSPLTALQAPLSHFFPNPSHSALVTHLEPNASLGEAIDLILEGAQNLIIPIQSRNRERKKHIKNISSDSTTIHNNNQEYCWLTLEDIIRYLLNSIGLFRPSAIDPINSLRLIDSDNIPVVHYDDPASSALPLISDSLLHQTSVAIVDRESRKLIGEISPFTLNFCQETTAAAIATLSAGDLMAYIDCGGPPEDLVQVVKERLEERGFGAFVELMEEEYATSSSSSDEEVGPPVRSGKLGGYSARLVRRSEAIVCYPWSSLVAVMIQALAHRVTYVWVVEEDGTLSGIVTFARMLKVLREHTKCMI